MPYLPSFDFNDLYSNFDAPVTDIDCGEKCRVHNPSGLPICCDICRAVPVGYKIEWEYLKGRTDLWHIWRGDECTSEADDPARLLSETPEHMLLMACKGPAHCQRGYRAVSCRQFPFFPYITADDRFLGLAYEWEFESSCWVINHLDEVTTRYREEFIRTYDHILAVWPDEWDSYAALSEDMREFFAEQKRRIPLLHRNGGYYLVNPASERLQLVTPQSLPRFGVYQNE